MSGKSKKRTEVLQQPVRKGARPTGKMSAADYRKLLKLTENEEPISIGRHRYGAANYEA